MENTLQEKCVICEENKASGIHIYHCFVCFSCERKIVSTDVNDPNYSFYVEKLKALNHMTKIV
ncbi:sigma factor G inhibitor Gin [Saliterribacillus persicus]|uniref:sigma factor G inhibitor Gin n=1 Tax=Saliterribacillus persicus TaxID=930114 RepID=UPI003CCC4788